MKLRIQTLDQARDAARQLGVQWKAIGDLMVTIEKFEPPAKNAHKNYLFVLVDKIAKATGDENEAVREEIKRRFGPFETLRFGDHEIHRPKSWSRLTRPEANDLAEQIKAMAAEYGVVIEDEPR